MSILKVIGKSQFLKRINVRALKPKMFLESLCDAGNLPACDIALFKAVKVGRGGQFKSSIAQQLETSRFHECHNLVLQELCTEQVRQIPRGSVAVQMYGLNDKRMTFMVLQLFRKSQHRVGCRTAGGTCSALFKLPKDEKARLRKLRGRINWSFCCSFSNSDLSNLLFYKRA